MTDANVETVEDVAVENIRGRMLTLKHKSGAIRVVVPENTSVLKRVIGVQSFAGCSTTALQTGVSSALAAPQLRWV